MKPIVFAIDPGTGISSACGIAVYDPNTDNVLFTHELRPSLKKPTWKRLADIVLQVKLLLISATDKFGPLEVRTESFVMRGKGGETLQRLIGGIIANIPWECTFVEVHNIVLKKNLTGNAKADKTQIGIGLLKRFEKNLLTNDLLRQLIEDGAEDALDAVAIAICTEVME